MSNGERIEQDIIEGQKFLASKDLKSQLKQIFEPIKNDLSKECLVSKETIVELRLKVSSHGLIQDLVVISEPENHLVPCISRIIHSIKLPKTGSDYKISKVFYF
jgi:hypothetical protein